MALSSTREEAEDNNTGFLWPLLKPLTFVYELTDLTPTIQLRLFPSLPSVCDKY